MTEAFLLGVVSSLIAAIIGWWVSSAIAPRVQALFRSEPDISGDWHSYDSNGTDAKPVGNAFIIQRGHKIRIELTRYISRRGTIINRKFSYNGTFHSGQLIATYQDRDEKAFISGAIVLRYSPARKALEGKAVYLDREINTVAAYDFFLQRSGASIMVEKAEAKGK